MPQGTDSTADAARTAWRRMRELIASPDIVGAEHRFMNEVGLTAGPVRALRALLTVGPQPMRVLADELGCDKSYVTGLVKPLLAKELVTLEPDASDGRVKVVTLTEAGANVAARAQRVHETPPEAISSMAPEALQELARLLGEASG